MGRFNRLELAKKEVIAHIMGVIIVIKKRNCLYSHVMLARNGRNTKARLSFKVG